MKMVLFLILALTVTQYGHEPAGYAPGSSCAADSVYVVCRLLGAQIDASKIYEKLATKGQDASMADMMDVLKLHKLQVSALKCGGSDIHHLKPPFIAQIGISTAERTATHFTSVVALDEKRGICLIDLQFNRQDVHWMKFDDFKAAFLGYVLVVEKSKL